MVDLVLTVESELLCLQHFLQALHHEVNVALGNAGPVANLLVEANCNAAGRTFALAAEDGFRELKESFEHRKPCNATGGKDSYNK